MPFFQLVTSKPCNELFLGLMKLKQSSTLSHKKFAQNYLAPTVCFLNKL